ncbi:hypothetical protein OPV22_010215 [Ensete ventricosum]|uniref:Uncharacterized protein n=1 Tax=Ensete ventricosum TaxID=4639 RepID=A0AAV8RKQ9_ENSVE|nr:hypothetical protein OPV22_010215 [Ensete ventricosum]
MGPLGARELVSFTYLTRPLLTTLQPTQHRHIPPAAGYSTAEVPGGQVREAAGGGGGGGVRAALQGSKNRGARRPTPSASVSRFFRHQSNEKLVRGAEDLELTGSNLLAEGAMTGDTPSYHSTSPGCALSPVIQAFLCLVSRCQASGPYRFRQADRRYLSRQLFQDQGRGWHARGLCEAASAKLAT